MPQRVFRTAAGVEWHVWSVIPGNALGEERRHGYGCDANRMAAWWRRPLPARPLRPRRYASSLRRG